MTTKTPIKKTSLTQRIYDDIKNAIASGILKKGDKLQTEQELMQQYQVSRVTVSNALSQLAKENIIQRYPGKGSFVNAMASTSSEHSPLPKFQHVGTPISIGLIMPSISDSFALNLVQGVASVFEDDPDFYLHISPSQGSQNKENHLINHLLQSDAKGFILFPVDQEIYSDKILELKLNKFPFVLIDRYFPGIATPYVISDNIYGGQLATAHLCDLGHKDILICTGTSLDIFSVKERVEGYKTELYKRNIPLDSEAIITNTFDRYYHMGELEKDALTKRLLDSKYTAIIATDSAVALFLYDFYKKHNICIPEDKSLISYDAPVADNSKFNPFTFIDQSEHLMGQKAGLILKELLLQTHIPDHFTQEVILPKLVVRHTTAAAK